MPDQGTLTGNTNRYPEELADRRWDNVGLLVDNTEQDDKQHKPVVMLTNDLTFQVAVDAIAQGASVIVSYRKLTPFPRALPSLMSRY